jgi:tripartite-type tricarboxylate transporter receptor subunit TctC
MTAGSRPRGGGFWFLHVCRRGNRRRRAELFKAEADLDVAIIPYKGTAPVMTDLIGGQVPMAFGVLPPALGNLKAGTLRAIAITSTTRFSLLPEVMVE